MNELTLAHDFLLLALDDNSGSSLCEDDFALHASVSAAFLTDMMFRDRLVPVAANKFQLVDGPLSPGLLGQAEEGLVGKGPATISASLSSLRGFWGNRDLEGWLKADLVERGILRPEADRFLFITYRTRHPAADMRTEDNVIERLRAHLATVEHEDPPGRDDALIGLLRASKLLGQVWSEPEQEVLRPLILERTKRAPIGKDAKEAADSARAAMIVATTVAVT